MGGDSMARIKKEKLVEKIYMWVVKDGAADVSTEKEVLFKMMIEGTLEYLYAKGHLKLDTNKPSNGKHAR